MGKQLIIVESPAKVKTIKKFLGSNYMVEASVGHVRDLPSRTLGVDEANDFAPQYEIIEKKKARVNDLRQAASKADTVYLAPDPDREGEAIAWHVAELIKDKASDIKRIQFNEITERAVRDALNHPRELDIHLFDAQQARRILDRLVGYKISPLLWNTIKRGISAGRVQSVALRLIVEREEERSNFVPREYWPIHAILKADEPPLVKAELVKVNNKKAVIESAEQAENIERIIAGKVFIVQGVDQKERAKTPPPPFITSTLQQQANQRYGYTAKRTMQVAQKLYEGVELENRGVTALITYMRTDSTRIADEALQAVRQFVKENKGSDYLPSKPRIFKAKVSAQDAHEAIRPVDVNICPDMVKDQLPPDQYNIYNMIWLRFVASQMAAARVHDTNVVIECGSTLWKAKGERILFDGYMSILPKTSQDEESRLPPLVKGQELALEKLEKEQKFTQPPARYSEATLVKELEDKGIGRPSTYAAIISTLLEREYVLMEDKRLVPTDLGTVVCKQLVEHFAKLMDVSFTAKMEEDLDLVADGKENWVELLKDFTTGFNPALESAAKNMQSIKKGLPAGLSCPECGKELLIKFGKTGSFLACSGYPGCRYTSNFERNSEGKVEAVERESPQYEKIGVCPECGKDLVVKKTRAGGHFIACTGYPQCHHAEAMTTGVRCPVCKEGEIVEKSSKKGKLFYSCSRYPDCNFALWNRPVPSQCPRCSNPYLIEKKTKDGLKIVCPVKGCGYMEDAKNAQTDN